MWFCLLCHNFPPPRGRVTRGTEDLLILIVNENEKRQHTALFKQGTGRKEGADGNASQNSEDY